MLITFQNSFRETFHCLSVAWTLLTPLSKCDLGGKSPFLLTFEKLKLHHIALGVYEVFD